MYQETLKRKPLKGFKTFLGIIILVYSMLALMLLVGYLQNVLHISFLQYVLLGGVILLAVRIVRGLTTEYVYEIDGQTVRIYTRMGTKQKLQVQFDARDIRHIGNVQEVSGFFAGKKRRNLLFDKKIIATYIVLSKDVVGLSPTEVFAQKLGEVYEKTDR